MLWITLLLFVVGGTVAEIKNSGPCPSVVTIKNFVVSKYMGRWYEAARYSGSDEIKCVKADYTLRQDGSFKITTRQKSADPDVPSTTKGIAGPVHNFNDGKFTIRYLSPQGVRPEPYWVLATNYKDWSLVWSCRNSGRFSFTKSQVLTRKLNPSDPNLEKAYQAAKDAKINTDYYVPTDQTNCK